MTTDSESELVPAVGIGEELFDAPALFYLTHAEDIRRWCALGDRTRTATNEFLDTISQDFVENAGADWSPSVHDTQRDYRHALLARPGTPVREDGTPAIAFCFGWHKKKVRITPHSSTPFVGVRVAQVPGKDDIRARFLDTNDKDARRVLTSRGYEKGREWPVWKRVTGTETWWHDLDAYRQQVLSAFEQCRDDFSSSFDEVALM